MKFKFQPYNTDVPEEARPMDNFSPSKIKRKCIEAKKNLQIKHEYDKLRETSFILKRDYDKYLSDVLWTYCWYTKLEDLGW